MKLGGSTKIDLIRKFSILTPELIVKNQYPAICTLCRSHSQEQVEEILILLVDDLSKSFDSALDGESIKEVAIEISSSTFRNLSLEDIFYAFRQIKMAKNYGKLNLNKILKSLQEQLNKRSELITLQNYNNHISKQYSAVRNLESEIKKHREAHKWNYNKKPKNEGIND